MIDEVRDAAKISSEAMKRRIESKYKTKVISRSFIKADFVLRRAHPLQIEDKLSPKWTGPFRIKHVLDNGPYILETLDGLEIPLTFIFTLAKHLCIGTDTHFPSVRNTGVF